MKYIEHRFALDTNDTASQVSLSVKKGDTARRLRINLSAGGYPYHIGDDCYAVFSATKPDGHLIFNNCTIEDCVIVYDFTPQTVAAVGLMDCEIILYGSGGAQLTSAGFHIIVEESNYTGLESSSEATALAALISEVQALRADVKRSTIYIGSDQPKDGTVYWLDTSSGVAYSVTANLTNATNSNATESVNDGESYEAVLTAAEGYALSEVSVIMGGVDVTADVYAEGVITIPDVTGDVIITATAKEYVGETVEMTHDENCYGMAYSDAGETELASVTRGGYYSATFEEETTLSVSLVVAAYQSCYLGYGDGYAYRATHAYNATKYGGGTYEVEYVVPAGKALVVTGCYSSHVTLTVHKKG